MMNTSERQRYRFRGTRRGSNVPEWLRPGGVYEGDMAPASQGAPGDAIRLLSPEDSTHCCMVPLEDVEEI